MKKIISVCAIVILCALGLFFVSRDRTDSHQILPTQLCASYSGIPDQSDKTVGMVWLAGGDFIMGNDDGYIDKVSGHHEAFPEEAGAHEVHIDGFWMDAHEITNAQFEKFVDETGYITVAERKPKKEWLPLDFPEDKLIPGSAVFVVPDKIEDTTNIAQWWTYVHGANWRHPYGPDSDIEDKMNHPVVQVAYEDALAYAKWAGQELPPGPGSRACWDWAIFCGSRSSTS